jgi:protein O-GlcNAc transferase
MQMGDANFFQALGSGYSSDFARTIQAFERSVSLNPSDLGAYRSAADAALAEAAKLESSSKRIGSELKRYAALCLAALGEQQRQQGFIAAEQSFREAIAVDQKSARGWYGLGEFLGSEGRYSEAERALRRAISIDPKLTAAYVELGNLLQSVGRYSEMTAAYRRAINIDPTLRQVRETIDSASLLAMLYDSQATPAQIYDSHRAWGEQVVGAARKAVNSTVPFSNSPEPGRRLRVAFLSPDFRYHAVSFFFEPLLTHHDRSAIDVYCYADLDRPDFVTAGLQKCGGTWRQTRALDDAALRAQLRFDQIDIAIDLAGHTGPGRLHAFAVKPAPVTATWLGYPATTGLPTIDWRITDAKADPSGQEAFHTEQLMRLPRSFLSYHFFGSETPAVAPPPAIARDVVTFGSFNNPRKLSAPTIAAWARILSTVPKSRLMLKATIFKDQSLRQHFADCFKAEGVSLDRLVLREHQPGMLEHLTSYSDIDIALDPFPYNGTTTTCEALFMGAPVVSLIGDHHAARVGFDILSIVGAEEFAAPDIETYVATAAGLAGNAQKLREMRNESRERLIRSPLGDGPGFARDFEAALRQMWQRWC